MTEGLSAPRQSIETDVSPDVLQRLFDRIHAQWKKLGEDEPYWSVVTWKQYLKENYAANAAQFNESGAPHAAVVDYLTARNGIALRGGTCLELGCGVGRVTQFLAKRFNRVIAVDVSSGNLAICKEHLAKLESGMLSCT